MTNESKLKPFDAGYLQGYESGRCAATAEQENVIKRREAVIKILEKQWHDAERHSRAWATLARSLAIELECFLLACEDSCATAKYWQSAHDMIEDYRAEVERLLTDGDPDKLAALRGPSMLGV